MAHMKVYGRAAASFFGFVSATSGLSEDAVVTAEDVATMSPEQALCGWMFSPSR